MRQPTDPENTETTRVPKRPSFLRGLSGKLLVLTVIFVMIAEVLIFVPSVANFCVTWLQNKLDTAEVASIVFLDSKEAMLSGEAQQHLLDATQSMAVAVREGGMSTLMASDDMETELTTHINLDDFGPLDAIGTGFKFLTSDQRQYYRVFATMKSRDAIIELVQEDRHLVSALLIYSKNVLLISFAISLITAILVFLALHWMIVQPIRNISGNMSAFSDDPENSALIYSPSNRRDEIGIAEHRLADFQADLQHTLRQKRRLADLGLAVSQVNHDLRNILATALLLSDRLSNTTDPAVQQFAPKLIKTIDRAVEYTSSVLGYSGAREERLVRSHVHLHQLADEVYELLGLDQKGVISWVNDVPQHLKIEADAKQLFRVLMNICRNAVQAMEAPEPTAQILRIGAERNTDSVSIRISDTGPGIGKDAREKFFQAFQGSTRQGGTGLGMSIAADLMRAHGGSIAIERTDSSGTVIVLNLPDDPGYQDIAAE
ncbi:MAG: HAMP domain-containing sensor histidine kinase [Rhizobiaceae bacterium]